MTRYEFRSLILSLPVNENAQLIITEQEYPKFRQETVTARKNGYEITFWTRKMGKGLRQGILNKQKEGDVESYKKDIKWE